jgi:perosamine synthetase
MFSRIRQFGDHTVLRYSKSSEFIDYVKSIFGEDLENLYKTCPEFCGKTDVETPLHKKFYSEIKSNNIFKNLYIDLVENIHRTYFPSEPWLAYQSFPSIRFQFPGSVAVPPHCDSDEIGNHPLGEKNFLMPITRMKGTTRIFIESEPQKGDFAGVELEPGDLFFFNGNRCIHYNEVNAEQVMRISFDFRIICPKDYLASLAAGVVYTKPRDENAVRKPVRMLIGGYYQTTLSKEWFHFSNTIVQSRPSFGQEEARALNEYMTQGEPFLTEFKETEKLENIICEFLGVKHCVMTTSGTTALMAALLCAGIGPGKRVLVPAYTMVATLNAVKAVGGEPVIVDIDNATLTLGLDAVRNANVDAIIHVSLNNRDAGIQEIANYCKSSGIILIEDAAQSFGCTKYGTNGDMACFSLSTPKIISTGQGGFVITNNTDLYERLKTIKNFGRKTGGIEVYESFGLNFKFTDMQAVVGQEQMKKMPERIQRYKQMFELYSSHIKLKPVNTIPWFIDYEADDRDGLSAFLKNHGVETRNCYPALASLPNTDRITSRLLFLPTHMHLTDSDINYICSLIKCFEIGSRHIGVVL